MSSGKVERWGFRLPQKRFIFPSPTLAYTLQNVTTTGIAGFHGTRCSVSANNRFLLFGRVYTNHSMTK